MKSMKLSQYFEILNPEYVYLKITPLKSLRNYNSEKIIKAAASLYRTLYQRINFVNKKLFFSKKVKIAYYIYMEKQSVQFYFVVPRDFLGLLKDKIADAWNGVTIEEVADIPLFDNKAMMCYMDYRKEDALSLDTDKRSNTLLSSILATTDILEYGDRVGVFYNFVPINSANFRPQYRSTLQKLESGIPIDKNKADIFYLLKLLLSVVFRVYDFAVDTISFEVEKRREAKKQSLDITPSTKKKQDSRVSGLQVLIMSESHSVQRANNNILSVSQAFQSITGDNELVAHKVRTNFNPTAWTIPNVDGFIISPDEGKEFVSLPGRELIEEHKIECVGITESPVPEKLRTGYIPLGVNVYKGQETRAYLRDNYDQGNFPLVTIGEQGSGKTTYLGTYVNAIQSRNEGCLLIDYIKNCELAETIKQYVSPDKLMELDMSDISSVQGIGYNELLPRTDNAIDKLDIANRKALYIQMLVDALNADGEPLSTSMDRYLTSAANVVMLDHNASLKDVTRCLNNAVYRSECIAAIPPELTQYLQDEIDALKELDDEKGATRTQKVDGINHRINFLRKDLRLKAMYQRDCSNNIDLVKAMEDGKIILVKMPQEYFATPYSKNVMVTYLFTKIWAATLVRGGKQDRPKRFHVIVDEIFQAKTAMALLKTQEILPQTRKFGLKFVFSCQSLTQISAIDQTLRNAGASYMLLKGSGKANFNEFKDELSPFTLEDLENLPQYSSLNIINYEDGRQKFITKLPPPIKKSPPPN